MSRWCCCTPVASILGRSARIPDQEVPDFLKDMYAEVSPDGAEHFPVVMAKLAALHVAEPTLTAADLREISSRTLVMVGDDDLCNRIILDFLTAEPVQTLAPIRRAAKT